MIKLYSGWQWKKLNQITECLDSKRIPITENEREKGEVPYYGANGIQGYVKDYIFDEELLLLAEDGGSWGKNQKCVYIIRGKSWVNNHAHVLRMTSSIMIKFLEAYLNITDLTKYISGSTRGKLNQKQMNAIEIPVPPLPVQKQIVSILERTEKLKEKRKKANEDTNKIIQNIFYKIFGDPAKNENGFHVEKLNDVCDVRDGTHDSPKYKSEGYPLVTSKNVKNGYVDFSIASLISKEDLDKINKRSAVNDGDIIMPMIGTIGNPVIIKKDREFGIKNVALIKFTKSNISNIYIKSLLSGRYFDYIIGGSSRGGTQKFIALKDIRNFPIPVPPAELQKKFAEIVKKIESLKEKQKQSTEEINTLFDALMQKAFKGELVA